MVNGLDIEPAHGASVVLAVGGTETSFFHQNAAYLVSSNATIYLPLPLPGGSTIKVPVNWSGGTLSEALNGGGGDFADSTLQQAMSGHAPGVTPPLPGGPVDINVSSIEYVKDPETGDVVPRPHSSVVVPKFDIASALNEVKPAGLPFTLTGTAQPSFDIAANGILVNPLTYDGYPSIGWRPRTMRVQAGADPRSGRWAGTGKTECGIHV